MVAGWPASREVRGRRSGSGSGRGDDDHPDMLGSAEPVPHDSQPSPNCPHTTTRGSEPDSRARGCFGIGIDDKFIDQVRETVTPGTSALFLYTENVQGAVLHQLKTAGLHPTLIQSNLSEEQEARLREALGEEP